MRIRVLGCWGGELEHRRATSLLVDGRLAIDAGALTSSLPLGELMQVEHVLLTHAHLDHVKDVPLLADVVATRRERPVMIHGSPSCVRTLRADVFNGRLWPDFTRLPHERRPALALRPFRPRRPFRVGDYSVTAVRVAHAVPCHGFILCDGEDAIAVSGDTGPTNAFWRAASLEPKLRALFVETSFPSRLQRVADASGHLTPRTLPGELAKLRRDDVPVFLYHLKPGFESELRRELARLERENLRILRAGEELVFSSSSARRRATRP